MSNKFTKMMNISQNKLMHVQLYHLEIVIKPVCILYNQHPKLVFKCALKA